MPRLCPVSRVRIKAVFRAIVKARNRLVITRGDVVRIMINVGITNTTMVYYSRGYSTRATVCAYEYTTRYS